MLACCWHVAGLVCWYTLGILMVLAGLLLFQEQAVCSICLYSVVVLVVVRWYLLGIIFAFCGYSAVGPLYTYIKI